MKLIEKHICVDKEAKLPLPIEFINAAALQPDAEMTVVLAVPENGEFPFPMMTVIPEDSVLFSFAQDCGEDEEDELSVPCELLEAAGIPIDSDLDVACYPGAIVITELDVLNRLPDGLGALFQSFGIRPDTVREVMKKEGYFV